MDPKIRAYFIRILNTISFVLLWMIINLTAGIKYNLAFIENTLTIGNVLFYIWVIISLGLLLWRLYKIWHTPLDIEF